MSLSQRLDVRQSQSLVMTPQLQQAIKLLQMSNQELGDFVAQEIEQNPLLERGEDSVGERLAEHVAADSANGDSGEGGGSDDGGAAASANADQTAPLSGEELSTTPASEDGMWEQDGYDGGGSASSHSGSFDGEDYDAAQNVATGPSLREHLLGQIHVDFTDTTERMIAVALVEMLDEAGYLPATLDLMRAQLGASA
jgi:RNA polymerase sigma-54 factor